MPTLLERTGDFSQSIGAQGPVTIYDPLTGNPFPGNVIPTNRINPAVAGLLKYYPRRMRRGTNRTIRRRSPRCRTATISIRASTRPSTTKNRLNGGIGYQGSNNTTPNIFSFIDTGTGRSINANVCLGPQLHARA